METAKVLVYLDDGVDPMACRRVVRRLRKTLPKYCIKLINHSHFLTPNWDKKVALLVMPGGQDIPYDRALKGEANRRIRAYVERGGNYFGICAGAYYGAAEIEFEKGGKNEVCERRELAFFPKRAIGPAYEKNLFRYNSDAGARIAQISWSGGVTPVHFNGGCYFEECENSQVVARFHDHEGTPPAVIVCQVGKGSALLCGVHPEYPQDDVSNEAFWKFLLSTLSLTGLAALK